MLYVCFAIKSTTRPVHRVPRNALGAVLNYLMFYCIMDVGRIAQQDIKHTFLETNFEIPPC
jgi:hypothetical protein